MSESTRLQVLACADCGALDPGGRTRCSACGGELAQHSVSGRGTLLTWTLVRRPPAGFDTDGPMAVALVELEEGVRITAQLASHDPEPDLGAPVAVTSAGRAVPLATLIPVAAG
jgi:uncharacterized OB-fold protein